MMRIGTIMPATMVLMMAALLTLVAGCGGTEENTGGDPETTTVTGTLTATMEEGGEMSTYWVTDADGNATAVDISGVEGAADWIDAMVTATGVMEGDVLMASSMAPADMDGDADGDMDDADDGDMGE